ncbi:hypothetical protein ES703_54026 [subsurface metagenome]
MLARPEIFLSKMKPLYSYEKFSAVGVVRFFVSAKAAGGDRPTVVMSAVVLQSAKPIKKPKKDTVRQKKGKKHIVRLKTTAGWD